MNVFKCLQINLEVLVVEEKRQFKEKPLEQEQ